MSYLGYYGLEQQPFSNAPDPRFYFNSDQHSQALLRLIYAVDSNKGLAVLLGNIGTGKTTLARRMLDSLPDDKYESSLLVVVHSDVTAEWIITRIALQLGVRNPAPDRLTLLKQLYERLLEIEEAGRKAVVLIDEAQMLRTRDLMEEFRGLLNLEIPGKKLLNIVFFGLPELDECMRLDPPLAQRIAVKFHLHSFPQRTTDFYIKHRLQVAGAKRMLFDGEAVEAIYQFAGGVPRLINTLCDNALFESYLRRIDTVSHEVVQHVAGDLDLEVGAPSSHQMDVQREEHDAIDRLLDQLESHDG